MVKPHDCDRCNQDAIDLHLARGCATSGPNLTGIAQRMFSRRPERIILAFTRRGDLPRAETDPNLEMASDRRGQAENEVRKEGSRECPTRCEGTRVECLWAPPPEGSMFQTVSRAVLNLREFVVREVRTNLEWASMSA